MTRPLLPLLACLALACAPPTAPVTSGARVLALVAFDGHAVPTVTSGTRDGTGRLDSGRLELDADGTFRETLYQTATWHALPVTAHALSVRHGTYRRERQGRVTFRLSDGTGWVGTETAHAVTYAAAGQRFTFQD